jgi:hypothetical protein
MARRNSPNDIQDLNDLSRLGEIVIDKRRGQRAAAKKNRRNRHYENQFIRNTLAHQPLMAGPHSDEADADADKSSESAASDLPGETP